MRHDFVAGARNAVRVCLGITGRDRVALVFDEGTAEIAEAIDQEALGTGAEVGRWKMEDHVERPASDLPRSVADEIRALRPTASIFMGESKRGELAYRQPLLHLLVEELHCRHGHMPGVDEALMTDGMAVDYEEVYRVTRQVYDVARTAARIEVSTRAGTDLKATFSPALRWIPCDGRYHEQGHWGNLPEGETFTAPLNVDGVIAGEEMGDWFTHKYGVFEAPVRLRVRASRLAGVETDNEELALDIAAYMSQHANSNRVGEFAIGTNVGLKRIVGNFLQDEKFPGVHMAFGDPYGFETGADWECPTHVDVLASHADVTVDGRKIMEQGRILL